MDCKHKFEILMQGGFIKQPRIFCTKCGKIIIAKYEKVKI